jgi:hypothetical protein
MSMGALRSAAAARVHGKARLPATRRRVHSDGYAWYDPPLEDGFTYYLILSGVVFVLMHGRHRDIRH